MKTVNLSQDFNIKVKFKLNYIIINKGIKMKKYNHYWINDLVNDINIVVLSTSYKKALKSLYTEDIEKVNKKNAFGDILVIEVEIEDGQLYKSGKRKFYDFKRVNNVPLSPSTGGEYY